MTCYERKSKKPTISSENEIEKWRLRIPLISPITNVIHSKLLKKLLEKKTSFLNLEWIPVN